MSFATVIAVSRQALLAAVLLPLTVLAADTPPLFAAPPAGHAAGPAGSGSIGQVTIALAVVLAFVFAAAWALRYLRKLNIAGNAQQLQIVAQVSLGAKERAVLIRINDTQVLVGVAPGQVTALHTFAAVANGMSASDAPSDLSSTPNADLAAASTSQAASLPQSFQAILKKSLGLS